MRLKDSVRAAALVAAIGVSAFAVACAGGGGSNSSATGTKATAPSSGQESAVGVELSEWGVKATGTAKPGAVGFAVKNSGTTPHELVVLKTDVDAGALQKDSSGVVDEKKYTVAGEVEGVEAGKTQKLELTLAAGKYVLLCNLPGHYDLGMRTAFTVS